MDSNDRAMVWLATLAAIGLLFAPGIEGFGTFIVMLFATVGIVALYLDHDSKK